MSIVLDAARRAFDTIPLYRQVYGDRPEREEDVPFLSVSAFHRAETPVDLVASAERIKGVVPPYRRGARRLPVTAVESEAESRLRLERLRHALAVLGVTPRAGLRFAVVADEATGPFASDIANFLAWDRAECAVIFLWDRPERIEATIATLAPDIILVAGPSIDIAPFEGTDARLLACLHAGSPMDTLVRMDRLLVSDELFVIGAARAGDASYEFDRRSVLIEGDPTSGRMAITTTAFDCLALIRACLDLPYPTTGAAYDLL